VVLKCNYKAAIGCVKSLNEGFEIAFKGGLVTGFTSIGLCLLNLLLLLGLYMKLYLPEDPSQYDYFRLMITVSAYALGTSTISLFMRLGGGIYSKAADLGTDLIDNSEDNTGITPTTMATIGDYVGDVTEDLCGMSSDLLDSCACIICGTLIISSMSTELTINSTLFPLLIMSNGIIVSLLATLYVIKYTPITVSGNIKGALRNQYIVGCILTIALLLLSIVIGLPSEFTFTFSDHSLSTNGFWCFICSTLGLISGLVFGYYTDKQNVNDYLSLDHLDTQSIWSLLYVLVIEYIPVIVPTVCIVVTIYVSHLIAGVYGICLAALGCVPIACIAITISGYRAIANNVCGIMKLMKISEYIANINGELDVGKKSTARIGKSFALGLAIFAGFSLFSAFIIKTNIPDISLLRLLYICGLLIGFGLPYGILRLVKYSVNKVADKMSQEIQNQFARSAQGTLLHVNRFHLCSQYPSLCHYFCKSFAYRINDNRSSDYISSFNKWLGAWCRRCFRSISRFINSRDNNGYFRIKWEYKGRVL